MFVDVSNSGGDGGAVNVMSTALDYVILPELGGAGSDCESGHCHCYWHDYDCRRRVQYARFLRAIRGAGPVCAWRPLPAPVPLARV